MCTYLPVALADPFSSLSCWRKHQRIQKLAYNVVKRKVQHCKGKYLKVCHVYNARILRSRKHLMERVLPRRSMRVVPKVRISLTAYGSILLLG